MAESLVNKTVTYLEAEGCAPLLVTDCSQDGDTFQLVCVAMYRNADAASGWFDLLQECKYAHLTTFTWSGRFPDEMRYRGQMLGYLASAEGSMKSAEMELEFVNNPVPVGV